MGRFIINGGIPLRGEVAVSGAKNSALPLLAACLLTEEEVVLHNCPRIGDVFSMQGILEKLGAHVRFSGNTICVAAKEIETVAMPEKLSKKILQPHQKAVPVHNSEVLPDNPHFLYKILCFSTAIFAIL